jgi:hypothetical protein
MQRLLIGLPKFEALTELAVKSRRAILGVDTVLFLWLKPRDRRAALAMLDD